MKRFCYQLHRWTGIAGCLLMALWFISGMVMLFVGYPKLTPWERLAVKPSLPLQGYAGVAEVLRQSASASEIVLTSNGGAPVYRVRDASGQILVFDAASGKQQPGADAATAMAAARAFLPGATAHYQGMQREDRWTHARTLDPHRPLHRVQMHDAQHTLLYLSSVTGEVLIDAPRTQRLWNFVGAWLHWVYPLRDRSHDPLWSWSVIIASFAATLTALSGTLVGIWRWRFQGRYKSGSRSPYRETLMRWHHLVGLAFAAIVCTWIFSGLMSMNPLRIFDASGTRPDQGAWRGATLAGKHLALAPQKALQLLSDAGFEAVELDWRVLDGRPYLLARDARARTRLVVGDAGGQVRERWDEATLLQAATHLMPGVAMQYQWRHSWDAYYYGREAEAMMGAAERRLPVLQLRFADAHANWVYIDPATGEVVLAIDRTQRVGRWLFSFLHSWDLPPMLRSGPWREALLVILSLGGLALSATGVVIGYRRLRVLAGRQAGSQVKRHQRGQPV